MLEPDDYGLSRGERLRDRIDSAWVLTKERPIVGMDLQAAPPPVGSRMGPWPQTSAG